MHVTVGLPQMEKAAIDAIRSIASCRTCGMWVKYYSEFLRNSGYIKLMSIVYPFVESNELLRRSLKTQ